MWDYLICSLKTSGILKTYFFHLIDLFYTWIEYLDPVIIIFFSHSFISFPFSFFESLLDSDRWNIYPYIITATILLLAWFIIDLLLYFLWKYLWKYVKFKYESRKLFYIFFRFVPIIWIFSVFIWALLSKEFNYKKDFIKIFIWNVLFIVVNVIFWGSMWQLCWRIMEGWFTF